VSRSRIKAFSKAASSVPEFWLGVMPCKAN
jgi:hypothetical protein